MGMVGMRSFMGMARLRKTVYPPFSLNCTKQGSLIRFAFANPLYNQDPEQGSHFFGYCHVTTLCTADSTRYHERDQKHIPTKFSLEIVKGRENWEYLGVDGWTA
jgi:hypothetical protein